MTQPPSTTRPAIVTYDATMRSTGGAGVDGTADGVGMDKDGGVIVGASLSRLVLRCRACALREEDTGEGNAVGSFALTSPHARTTTESVAPSVVAPTMVTPVRDTVTSQLRPVYVPGAMCIVPLMETSSRARGKDANAVDGEVPVPVVSFPVTATYTVSRLAVPRRRW